ncbi:MAG TPA: tRNA lysidine(34) synthetase TilS [Pseudolysinimonas sp.]|nr:tRNA lysidine(34) synthetase TilS [Pseudolysinimonas sp.]
MPERPRLTPAIADTRRAVREVLPPDGLVLVALSGGADSLALAAATAFEAAGRGGAVIIDHGLQAGSAETAERAAAQARALGLDPVRIARVEVGTAGGPEGAARDARYRALDAVAAELGAVAILLGHTLDDQAETVLLGLARGSGAASLQGMARVTGLYRRPFLGIRRSMTEQACADAGLDPWHDPHNDDPAYTRVRVRSRVLPLLEAELGPGVAEALARTAEQLREDSEALDGFADEVAEDVTELEEAGVSLGVAALAANPSALRQRLIRHVVQSEFHVSLSRAQTLAICELVTAWRGQKALDLPGFTAERRGPRIHLISTRAGELTGQKPPHDH